MMVLPALGLAMCLLADDPSDETPIASPPVATKMAWLKSPDVAKRREGAQCLGRLGQGARPATMPLLQAMSDPDAEVRWRAEFALGRIGAAGVSELIDALLVSRDPAIRRHAAYVLGPIGPKALKQDEAERSAQRPVDSPRRPDLLASLLAAMSDPDDEVRVWATKAVGDIGAESPEAIAAVTKALGSDSGDVKRLALRVLIALGPKAKAALPAVVTLLKDADASMRWMACIALRQMGPDAAEAAPALVHALADPDPDVRFRSAQALNRIGAAAKPALEQARDSNVADASMRQAASDVLKALEARAASASSTAPAQPDPNADARARWYNNAKVGLFVHWGLYAVPHRARPGQLSEWIMDNEKIPNAEYQKFADSFTAAHFDPDAWARLADETGLRYLVLTSKHHDGFCLFDSESEPYNAARFAAAKRDVVGDLAAACERRGVKFCTYYSLLDWHHPDYEKDFPKYVEHMHAQIREILTKYPTYGMWFDGEWTHPKAEWRGDEIIAMIRKEKPLAFVNDRLGSETRGAIEGVDFYTKEQEIPADALRSAGRPVAWETCQTFGYSWGYNTSPDPLKSGERIIEQMVDVVSKGGNFLLNIGPKPDGTIPEPFVERMKVIGAWMKKNGEAIYGSSRSPFGGSIPAGRVTTRENRLYVFLESVPEHGITLPGLKNEVKRAWLLDGGQELDVTRTGKGVTTIASPRTLPDPVFTVVAIELDGPPNVEP